MAPAKVSLRVLLARVRVNALYYSMYHIVKEGEYRAVKLLYANST